MAKELAFVLINPYSIRKSRTGGIIARYLVRTDLKLVGARLMGASPQLTQEYTDYLSSYDPDDPEKCELFASYFKRAYQPDATTGRPHRSILLLFEGENAINKIFEVTGSIRQRWCSGLSIRDTYGDLLRDQHSGKVEYFEPAVLVGASAQVVGDTLKIWSKYLQTDSGIVQSALDVPDGANVEQTLVLIKPDNWHQPSLRAGNIMDLVSSAGLRIVGVKKFSMTVSQAEEFYGPVRANLRKVFGIFGPDRAAQALSREFGFPVDNTHLTGLCDQLAPLFAEREFDNIVEFMTGHRPSSIPRSEWGRPGTEECLAIIYEGENAVNKIRDILGATDPTKARPGSIRREFGTNIMVNAAHASDSPANAQREIKIIDIEHDPLFSHLIRTYYP